MPPASPTPILSRTLRGRCPRCGEGALFDGYLVPAQSCAHCGLPLRIADSGDGPAVFLVFIIGAFVTIGAVMLEFSVQPPLWLHGVLWSFVTLAMTLGGLRPAKALAIGLQYKHRPDDFTQASPPVKPGASSE